MYDGTHTTQKLVGTHPKDVCSAHANTHNPADLGTLDNGNVTFTNTTFDSVATYSSNPGYALDGDATRKCLADGTWSATIPSCIGIIH